MRASLTSGGLNCRFPARKPGCLKDRTWQRGGPRPCLKPPGHCPPTRRRWTWKRPVLCVPPQPRPSISCTCCGRRSAGCSVMWSIWSQGQAARGHRVGLIVEFHHRRRARRDRAGRPCAASGARRAAGGDQPRARSLGYSSAAAAFPAGSGRLAPDVLHGHGAKGAALARLTLSAPQAIRVYTPHGGSLVYRPGTIAGGFYRSLEWLLKWRTDLFLFESSYIASLVPRQDRPAARRSCGWCTTASARPSSPRSCRARTRPTSSASANCGR